MMVTGSVCSGRTFCESVSVINPQLLAAWIVTSPPLLPTSTSIRELLSLPWIAQPSGIFQVKMVAPSESTSYTTTDPSHGSPAPLRFEISAATAQGE
jgi:hypothetical protein